MPHAIAQADLWVLTLGQLAVDLDSLGLTEPDRSKLAAAVQTTRSIIAEHA